MMKKAVYVISHTHWDREWYLTFEVFRQRMVRLLDKLIADMRRNRTFEFFHLDGQTIILEDYEEVGGQIEELLELVKEGRVQVGPWYVLPDEFLVSGEALIRNYLMSKRLAEKFDIPLLNVAYLPDMFGHSAYTPTILRGLGMEWAIVWRGVGRESLPIFKWKSPHGDAVNAYHLIDGYSNGAHFGKDREGFKEVLLTTGHRLLRLYGDTPPLMLNGTDHEIPLENVPKILEEISGEEIQFVHSNLETFVAGLPEPEEILEGELRSPKKEHVLKGVLSSRISAKLLNFETEILYQHYVEPLMALARLEGKDVPLEQLWYGWKLILRSQPHDSICGCSRDEVHETVVNRLKRALHHGVVLSANLMIEMTGEYISDFGLLVFNPLEKEKERFFEAIVMLPEGDWILEGEGVAFSHFEKVADAPKDIPHERWAKFLVYPSTSRIFDLNLCVYKCLARVKLPSFGICNFKIKRRANAMKEETRTFHTPFRILPNGTLGFSWYGKNHENIGYLKDVEDAGDEYNHSHLSREEFDSLKCEADFEEILSTAYLKTIRARFNMELPESLDRMNGIRSNKKLEMPVEIDYTFFNGEPRVDIRMKVNNVVKDHRLSIVFPIGNFSSCLTDGYFGVIRRERENFTADLTSWAELPENIYPLFSFVAFPTERMLVVTRGLHELHLTTEGFEITILRSVEWLSRGDLVTRRGYAGPMIHTPNAQESGIHEFTLSLVLLKEGTLHEIYEIAREILLPPLAFQGEYSIKNDMTIPFCVEKGIVSAFKPFERGNGIILRVFEPSGGKPEVKFDVPVTEVNLAEDPITDSSRTRSVRSWLLSI